MQYKPVLLLLFFIGILLSVLGSGVDSSLTLDNIGFAPVDNETIVTVNRQSITKSELNHVRVSNPNLSFDESLNLMIDNDLLLQRAQELGLLQSDRVVRKAIVHRVVEQTVKKVLSKQETMSEQSLMTSYKSFYLANIAMFTTGDQFQLQIANVSNDDEQCNLSQKTKLQWQQTHLSEDDLQRNFINQPLAKGFHSEILVHRQLGSRLAKQVVVMEKGEFSDPILTDSGCILMYLSDKKMGGVLPFKQAKERVISQYRIMLRRNALTDLLQTLRENADIDIAQDIKEVLTHE